MYFVYAASRQWFCRPSCRKQSKLLSQYKYFVRFYWHRKNVASGVKCSAWIGLNSLHLYFTGTRCSTHSPSCVQWWLNTRHQTAGLPCCSSSINPPRAATLMTDRYRTHGTPTHLEIVCLSTRLTVNCIFVVGWASLFCKLWLQIGVCYPAHKEAVKDFITEVRHQAFNLVFPRVTFLFSVDTSWI